MSNLSFPGIEVRNVIAYLVYGGVDTVKTHRVPMSLTTQEEDTRLRE